jgi:putative restriction endonuclease
MPRSADHRIWTEEELVQVLSLYCQIPFGQMHSRNPVVIRFAESLRRTPGSVAYKLVNFASFDPALRARGVRGMSNASRLDRTVWDCFFGHWDTLASVDRAAQVVAEAWTGRITSTERITTVRVGQSFFRNTVLAAYQGKCCITGIGAPPLLRASHIIPWSVDESRRLDPNNGLCLNALHDAAFDAGLIGVDEDLCVTVSKSARDAMPQIAYADFFARYEGKKISVPERFLPNLECLRYHLEHVFIK